MAAVFVTGTDTSCGKTYISEFLLRGAKDLGLRATGMKPIATGIDIRTKKNEDIDRLMAVSSPAPLASLFNQYCYPEPCSPNIAAAVNGSEINLDRITSSFKQLNDAYELVVVEAVGGWKVPIQENISVADLAKVLGIPVILVVGIKLGCINHAILTAESIKDSKVNVVGWVANLFDENILFPDEVLNTLSNSLEFPLLQRIRKDASVESAKCFTGRILENIGGNNCF